MGVLLKRVLLLLLISFILLSMLTGCIGQTEPLEESIIAEENFTGIDSTSTSSDGVNNPNGELESTTAAATESIIPIPGEATKTAEIPISGSGVGQLVLTAANISVTPIEGYEITTSDTIIAMFAPGGSLNEGPAVVLHTLTIPDGETVAQTVAGFQNNGAANISNWITSLQDVHGRESIFIEYQYENQIGQEVLIPITSTLSLFISCYAPPEQWEITAPHFIAILESLQFLP